MNAFAFFVGGILPYVAMGVFIAAMVYRLRAWTTAPQPGKMTLFPAKANNTAKGVLAETLFFPSLFKGDRALWWFSWLFHAMLALVFVGHLRVFTGLVDRMLYAFGMTPDGVNWMSGTFGGAAGIVLLATATLLLIRRFTLQRVRDVSGAGDYVALFLLLAIIVTGDLMRFGSAHVDLEQTRAWAVSLATFSPVVPANSMFLVHALLAQLLIIYIPFSKILHFGGIFFSQALIKRR